MYLNPKNGGAVMLYRVNLRAKTVTRERRYTVINGPLNQEAVTDRNMYAPSISTSKWSGTAKDRGKEQADKSTVIVGNHSISLSNCQDTENQPRERRLSQ